MRSIFLRLALLVLLGSAVWAEDLAAASERVRVLHARSDCPSGILEVEIYDRESGEWVDHPEHARVFEETCQTEDAATLLNEIRTRCSDPVSRDNWGMWRVGVDVWNAEFMNRCEQHFPERLDRFPIDLEIVSPRRGERLESADLEVDVRGAVRVGDRKPGRFDLIFLLDVSEDMRRLGPNGRAPLYETMQALRHWLLRQPEGEELQVGLASFSYDEEPGAASRSSPPEMEALLDADRRPMLSVLNALATAPPGSRARLDAVLPLAFRELRERGRPEAFRAIVVVLDGQSSLPFGLGMRNDPALRRSLVEAAAPAREAGIPIHVIALGRSEDEAPEVFDEMLEGTRSLWLALPADQLSVNGLVALPLPALDTVEIQSSAGGERTEVVEWQPEGDFAARIALRDGENLLRLRAVASTGEVADAALRITLDNAELREVLLEQQRQYMQRVRSRGKRVVVEPEEEMR